MASRRPPPQRVSLPLVLSGAATPGLQATCVAEPGLDLEAYPKSNEALTSLTAPPEDETFSVRYMAAADDPPPPPTPQRPAAERPEQGRARGGLPREGEPFEADELPWQTGASQAAACAPPGRAAPPSGDLDLCMGVAERPSLGPGARGPSRWPCALPGSPGPLADCGALQRGAGLVRCGSARSVRSAASTKTASDIFDSALLKTPDGARAPSSASSARSRVLVVESPPGSSPLGGPFAGAPSCAGGRPPPGRPAVLDCDGPAGRSWQSAPAGGTAATLLPGSSRSLASSSTAAPSLPSAPGGPTLPPGALLAEKERQLRRLRAQQQHPRHQAPSRPASGELRLASPAASSQWLGSASQLCLSGELAPSMLPPEDALEEQWAEGWEEY